MYEEELDLVQCAECGADVDLYADRYYAFADNAVLCFECAIARGGQYDEDADTWLVPPDVSSLLGERRPLL